MDIAIQLLFCVQDKAESCDVVAELILPSKAGGAGGGHFVVFQHQHYRFLSTKY